MKQESEIKEKIDFYTKKLKGIASTSIILSNTQYSGTISSANASVLIEPNYFYIQGIIDALKWVLEQ